MFGQPYAEREFRRQAELAERRVTLELPAPPPVPDPDGGGDGADPAAPPGLRRAEGGVDSAGAVGSRRGAGRRAADGMGGRESPAGTTVTTGRSALDMDTKGRKLTLKVDDAELAEVGVGIVGRQARDDLVRREPLAQQPQKAIINKIGRAHV